tara:strand:- start:550 stop:723 length:174 start_codon:yes stop_codon:yes gene_type:complete
MLQIFKPILLAFIRTNSFKKLLIDLLRAVSKRTDNNLDDLAVDHVERLLLRLPPLNH